MEENRVIVRFQSCKSLNQGEVAAIIGSTAELGNWDKDKFIALWWQEGNVWRGSVNFRAPNSVIEYKYIIVNYVNNKIVWESDITRKITVDPTKNQIILVVDNWDYNAPPYITITPFLHHSKRKGIVVLGKRLLANGKPSEMLVNRVKEACILFKSMTSTTPITDIYIILTGGKVQKGTDSEAAVMKQLCISNGIPISQIVLEPHAMSTIYNALNSRDLLEDLGIKDVTIVTSDFHMARSKALFERVLNKDYVINTHEDHPILSVKEKNKEIQVEQKMLLTLQERLDVYLRNQ